MKATDFINFRKVSLFLAGGTENIRSNKIPAKYAEAVKELTDFMQSWSERNGQQHGTGKPKKEK